MRSKEFPHAPLERIARKTTGMRISRGAVKALRNHVLENAEERSREIVDLVRHAGRKTVMKSDVVFITGREK